MNPRERRSARVVACLLLGRLGATIGLVVCLTHVLLGHPAMLWRAAAGTAVGVVLLGEAASLVDDHRLFADELVRAVGLAALAVGAVVVRFGFSRGPRGVDARLEIAGVECAAGFVGAVLWLRRSAARSRKTSGAHST